MPVNLRQTAFAVGKVQQSDLTTANGASDLIRFTKVNRQSANLELTTEDDAQDIGKDDEFATQVFPLGWQSGFTLESYLTSEMAGWAMAFGLGNSAATAPASGAYRHTAVFQSSGIDLRPFTYVEKQPADGSYDDFALIGCVINGVTFQFNSGLGRQNAKVIVEATGTGNHARPSGLTLPAVGTLHGINAGGATITILGTNYTTAKTISSLEFGWRNNERGEDGYFPGSGAISGASIKGRMEHGDREAFLRFTSRLRAGSHELDVLKALTVGTAVITAQGALITGSTYHNISCTFQRVQFRSVVKGENNGIVTTQTEVSVQRHASNGVVTFYATNEIPLLGGET